MSVDGEVGFSRCDIAHRSLWLWLYASYVLGPITGDNCNYNAAAALATGLSGAGTNQQARARVLVGRTQTTDKA